MTQDADFAQHRSAEPADIEAFEDDTSRGPDINNLRFDMEAERKSPWNIEVLKIVKEKLIKEATENQYPKRSDAYWEDILEERFKHVKHQWRAARPKTTDGRQETATEVEERMTTKKDNDLKNSRHNTRRNTVRRQNKEKPVTDIFMPCLEIQNAGEDC